MVTRISETDAALTLGEFRLLDYRIAKIEAESFVDPGGEKVRGGMTRSKMVPGGSRLPSKDNPSEYATVKFTYSLHGYAKDDAEHSNAHFSIVVCAEFLFESRQKVALDEGLDAIFVRFAALQAYPVLVPKVRNIAHEMGFVGVNPALGIRLSPKSKDPAASPASVAPKKKRERRRVETGAGKSDASD